MSTPSRLCCTGAADAEGEVAGELHLDGDRLGGAVHLVDHLRHLLGRILGARIVHHDVGAPTTEHNKSLAAPMM